MLGFTLFLAAAVLSSLVGAALLQWLWNITLPELLGLKAIRYWQALRLLLISSLLFGAGSFLRFAI